MKELVEWCFDFDLLSANPDQPIPYQIAEDLMRKVINEWARSHDYSTGGGFREREEREAGEWRFDFGVCVNTETDRIPESKAQELLAAIQAFSHRHILRVEGGYREFQEDE